jgi:hypothetical protein
VSVSSVSVSSICSSVGVRRSSVSSSSSSNRRMAAAFGSSASVIAASHPHLIEHDYLNFLLHLLTTNTHTL